MGSTFLSKGQKDTKKNLYFIMGIQFTSGNMRIPIRLQGKGKTNADPDPDLTRAKICGAGPLDKIIYFLNIYMSHLRFRSVFCISSSEILKVVVCRILLCTLFPEFSNVPGLSGSLPPVDFPAGSAEYSSMPDFVDRYVSCDMS